MRALLNNIFDQYDLLAERFGGKSIFMLGLSLVLAIMMIFVNDFLIQNARQSTDVIATYDDVLGKVITLKASLYRAESAQRGYLLTHSATYLSPFNRSEQEVSDNVRAIQKWLLTANLDPSNKSKLSADDLLTTVSKKITEMRLTIEFAKQKEFDKALDVVKLGAGLKDAETIDSMLDDFQKMLQDKKDQYTHERSLYRTLVRLCVVVCPLVFILLVVMVIKRLMTELNDKAILQEKLLAENVNHEDSIKSLSTRLFHMGLQSQKMIEQERYQLARELHDELGSLLTATKMDIAWVIKNLKQDAPAITEKLTKTNQYLDRSINFKREIVQNLHPSMLTTFGLWPSIRTMIEDAVERNRWELDLLLPEDDLKIDETIGLIIYRLIQESLNNASKYAKATKLSLHVMADISRIKVDISDNGVGFDASQIGKESSGIAGMRNRIESVGGHFSITGEPDKGTVITAILPVYIVI